MIEFERKIENISNLVFTQNFNKVISEVLELMETIESKHIFTGTEYMLFWNELLQKMSKSLENSDYLLCRDLLKYELEPVLRLLFKEYRYELLQ